MSLSFRHDAGEGMLDRRYALGGYVEIDPTGRYGRFDELLGKGAMKTVYKAFDEAKGTEVAWNQAKLCSVMQSPEVLQRMYSEVHLLSSLCHESVIRIYASWIDVDKMTFNFVTEMFTSGTLREYRQRYPRVDVRAIKSWALQILQGLVYLHDHDPPVIHRDIKCDNILINGHLGQVKIGDFGLAAVLQGSQFAHSIIGTPEFMAPEFYEEEYNELVDIYSFGMCVLEMLTSEYPYSECFNSAQIYKKVTSGKLPDAFYNIQDPEAKRFVGRCLENVSKRSSANELLLDPFLTIEDITSPLLTLNTIPAYLVKDIGLKDYNCLHLPGNHSGASRSTDMTITGKINMEDNTIFLKVQITDKEGHTRNIYFPFDVASDTPIDVAMEMVKELEITDRKPSEIAEMIAQEVSMLVPDWKARGGSVDLYRVYAYKDNAAEGSNHHFYNLTSPTSPQGSLCSDDDHMISHPGKHSLVRYVSADEPAMNFQFRKVQSDIAGKRKGTKLCPRENHQAEASLPNEFHSQCNILPGSSATPVEVKKPLDCNPQLPKNWQLVDVRCYLRRQNLLEQLKKYLFKIIQVIENNEFLKNLSSSHRKCRSKSKLLPDKEVKRRTSSLLSTKTLIDLKLLCHSQKQAPDLDAQNVSPKHDRLELGF